MKRNLAIVFCLLAIAGLALNRNRGRIPASAVDPATAPHGTVIFQGGYQTDPRDQGRPVVLIAAALGVESDVFRQAFADVRPARFGPPSGARARANKRVLMETLALHGITNERLDEVSDYYRYRPERGERWHHQPAQATAVLEDGKLIGLTLVDGGSGYTVAPHVLVAGFDRVRVKASLAFGSDLETNGRVASLEIIP